MSAPIIKPLFSQRTLVLGHLRDLCKQLDKVWQVIAEELGTNNEVFAGVVGSDVGAQELTFTLYPESRTSLGTLYKQFLSIAILLFPLHARRTIP